MNELVDRRLLGDACVEATERAAGLRRLPLDSNQVLDVEKIANGTFSPLTGFSGSKDYRSVCEDMRLADGTPWSIPIILQVPSALAAEFSVGEEVHLWNDTEDRSSGLLTVEEIYEIDLTEQAEKVYGTTERAHPGVDRMMQGGTTCVAGPVWLLTHSESLIPPAYDLDPAHVRAEIANRGWKTVTGFQTRNLGHKAHEHLQKVGLELTDGLLIHPLIGWKKPGDMLPEIILEGYELLMEHYYPKDRVMLAGLTTAMRYAGPREALFHSIIRRNFGCTHFIVGRDHAGVGGYYEKYAGHRVFDRFTTDELGIIPLRLHGPSYCKVCDEIVTEAICPHGPDGWVDISGTEVRAMVGRGECPPSEIMRPEIARFLVEKAKVGAVFFEG
ncbi:MAG: sulfate adenylyltransferase [Planctomycetes bacterium]|nr:sulfate adenylyltransferase [Planctomycetota bacterium]